MTLEEFVQSNIHLADQTADVLDFMIRHDGFITTMDAIHELNCTRLPARIWDLRNAGLNITCKIRTKKKPDGKTKRWGEYKLHGLQ